MELRLILTAAFLFTFSFAFDSSASILGDERAEVCSSKLGNAFSPCPQNFKNKALAASAIHSEYSSCDHGPTCIGGDFDVQTRRDYFTFFDVDNEQTIKYEITISPNVYNSFGSLILPGSKSAREIEPSDAERDVTEEFANVARLRNDVQKMYNLSISSTGTMTNAHGERSSIVPRSASTCLTALDYRETERNCAGDLVRDIREGVQDNATFFGLISSLTKLESVIDIVVPLDIDLTNLNELASFNVVMNFADGSVLALNVEVDEGAVSVVLNEDASITSEGRTFADAKQTGVSQHGSLIEAKLVAGGSFVPVRCEPANFKNSSYVAVAVIIIRHPDGSETVRTVYQKQDTYVTYQSC